MRLPVAGALLLLGIGVFTAGCGTGVSGAAATFQNPETPTAQANGSPAAGQFGGAPWTPISGSRLSVKNAPNLLRSKVLVRSETLTRQKRKQLSTRQQHALQLIGAQVAVAARPAPRSTYTFECWIQGSPGLSGSRLVVEFALAPTKGPWAELKPVVRSRAQTGWRRYSVTRTVPSGKWKYLHAVVYTHQTVPRKDWLALSGAIAKQDR
jgi:hypothetical protein